MNLSHYSKDAAIAPRSVEQDERPDYKPKGLWVSVDGEDDWAEWCRNEDYSIGQHRHRVTLSADVLVLATVEDIRGFHHEYHGDLIPGVLSGVIRWDRVAATYPGIIIAPYQWSLRLDREIRWYYPWDCASGCIWDAAAIESVALAEAVEL